MQQITLHHDAALMLPKIEETRIALAGEFFVKEAGSELLPHPSDSDTTSTDAKNRYNIYLKNAEYQNYGGQTLASLLGRMKIKEADIQLPERLSYLLESADNDGTSLTGMIEQTASELMPIKWQVLVSDYLGLSEVDLTDVSIEDVKRANPRATVKAYNRDKVVNWHFSRINGAMQLTYIMLREDGSEFDISTAKHTAIKSYLVLALDDDGFYFQQKIVERSAGIEEGERSYMTVGGKPLMWLPVTFASDEEIKAGALPKQMGFISPICELSLARYRMSAEYKETIRNLPPTTYVFGARSNFVEQFSAANGRDYIETGSGSRNVLPEGCTVEVIGCETSVQPYEQYFERNTQEARQMGAVLQGDVKAATATEAEIAAAENNARLVALAQGLESAYQKAILYCGMFEGLWSADAIEQNMDQVVISLPRTFAKSKLSVEEVRVIMELVLAGLKPRELAIRELAEGGWSMDDAEAVLDAMDSGDNLTV